MVNHLIGGGDALLEIGVGVVPARLRVKGEVMFVGIPAGEEGWKVLGTVTLGSRLQPVRGEFAFRIGLTPLTNFKEVVFSGGFSGGYCF
jgi:hypothetical protein